jgi:hypothetical protein
MKGKVIDGSSKFVLDFLRSRRDQAFTQDEIIKAVNPHPTPESIIHFLDGTSTASGSGGKATDFN